MFSTKKVENGIVSIFSGKSIELPLDRIYFALLPVKYSLHKL